jgi:hypothetical protein
MIYAGHPQYLFDNRDTLPDFGDLDWLQLIGQALLFCFMHAVHGIHTYTPRGLVAWNLICNNYEPW